MSYIPKIKVEITYRELCAVLEAYNSVSNIAMPIRNEKTAKSIILPLLPKLIKKELDKRNAKKPFKISLHFYEADYLEEFLKIINNLSYNHFLQNFINKLNQELA